MLEMGCQTSGAGVVKGVDGPGLFHECCPGAAQVRFSLALELHLNLTFLKIKERHLDHFYRGSGENSHFLAS